MYYRLFYHLENQLSLDPLNELHLLSLHYVYLPWINWSIEMFYRAQCLNCTQQGLSVSGSWHPEGGRIHAYVCRGQRYPPSWTNSRVQTHRRATAAIQLYGRHGHTIVQCVTRPNSLWDGPSSRLISHCIYLSLLSLFPMLTHTHKILQILPFAQNQLK